KGVAVAWRGLGKNELAADLRAIRGQALSSHRPDLIAVVGGPHDDRLAGRAEGQPRRIDRAVRGRVDAELGAGRGAVRLEAADQDRPILAERVALTLEGEG